MKKKFSVLAVSSLLIAGTAFASGYRIPEQSVDGTAKAGANIASSSGAVTSFYNPANMSWSRDAFQFEADLTYINLPHIEYDDNRSPYMNGSSKTEQFLIPTFFLVSPDVNNFRFGLSLTAPYGLAKRWDQPFPRSTVQEYSLEVYDMNPSVSYKVDEMFSVAVGVHMIYSSAEVSSVADIPGQGSVSRYMDGDAYEWGYNLALSLVPSENVNISVTYRSNVDLELEGDATLATTIGGPYAMATGGNVSVPAPAVVSVSWAYTMGAATVDLTWDRTFWSKNDTLDFTYDSPVLHPVLQVFTQPVVKNWDDSNAYRIGLDYVLNQQLTLMAGFAYDENPVPEENLGFDLPDSDAWLYSIGAKYRLNEQMEIGMAYLYDYKESRTVVNGDPTTGINGEFTGASAHLVSLGISYDF
jgi:long-chain fatty acid transport protein